MGELIQKGKEKEIVQNITLEESLKAPINKGQVVGEVNYILEDKTIAKANLVAAKEIKKVSFINYSVNIIDRWFNLIRD